MASQGFEGFDYESNYHMTEKEQMKDNWSQAKIWIILGIFMGLCLGMSIYMNIKEVILKNTANTAIATYTENASCGLFYDEQGHMYSVSLENTMVGDKSGNVTVYYYGDDMRNAKVLTAPWFWVAMYCLWLPLFLLCVRFAYKNITGDTKRSKANKKVT